MVTGEPNQSRVGDSRRKPETEASGLESPESEVGAVNNPMPHNNASQPTAFGGG
jgi:hypothetical protein